MVADVPVVPGLVSVDPLTGEEAMYVPAAQTDAQSLSLVHVWFQPSWIVRTAAPVEGLTAQMQHALSVLIPTCLSPAFTICMIC